MSALELLLTFFGLLALVLCVVVLRLDAWERAWDEERREREGHRHYRQLVDLMDEGDYRLRLRETIR